MTTRTWLFIGGGVLILIVAAYFWSKNRKNMLRKKIDNVNEDISNLEYKKFVAENYPDADLSTRSDFDTTIEEDGGMEGLNQKILDKKDKKKRLRTKLSKLELGV